VRIVGYTPDFFGSPPGCQDGPISYYPEWDGIFDRHEFPNVQQIGAHNIWNNGFGEGIRLEGNIYFENAGTPNCWRRLKLSINPFGSYPGGIIWEGTKNMGNTWSGVYEQTDGCHDLSTITLENVV